MGIRGKVLLCITTLRFFGLGAMDAALAAPPSNHKTASRLNAHPALDLRPSASALAAAGETAGETPAAFPSSLHRHALGAQEQIELPVMGTAGGRTRVPTRIEEFARRVHREGLPVAR